MPENRTPIIVGLSVVAALAVGGLVFAALPQGDAASPQFTAAPPASASATASAEVPAVAAAKFQVHFRGQVDASGRAVDSGSGKRHGQVAALNGGAVTTAAEQGNPFLRFPQAHCTSAPCPQAIVQLPGSLAPGAKAFTFGADVRIAGTPSPDSGMNVFQSGVAGDGISQWKLQLDYGHATCRWSDGTSSLLLPENRHDPEFALEPGRWYTIRCQRSASGEFSITVRPRGAAASATRSAQASTPVGAINPQGKLTIGGKNIGAKRTDSETDQFHGDLDEVVYGLN